MRISKGKHIWMWIIMILSYLPILSLLYFGLVNNCCGIDIKTLVLVLGAYFIKDLGTDIILQMIPSNYFIQK